MRTLIVAALFAAWSAGACASQPAGKAEDPLYTALGGKPGISAIIDTMLNNVADDTRIVHYFAGVNIPHVRHGLITKFCALAGGPCAYTGENMIDAHRGLHVTAAAFNALVEDLQAAMAQLHIPLGAQNRLLARLAKLRNQIVEPAQRD